jgi:hypothetical protein
LRRIPIAEGPKAFLPGRLGRTHAKKDKDVQDTKTQDERDGRETEGATLKVTYNGVTKRIEFDPSELVKAILDRSIKEFQVTQQPHLLSLFRADGIKVPEDQTAKAAGLRRGTELYLRQDQVKGGAC